MIVENKELTSKNAKISYKINEEKTDKRLIQILNELTIKILLPVSKIKKQKIFRIYLHTPIH
ncbi:MAG: hypothetical protein KIC56_07820 [Clostridium sp.]|nr:hypothetical protein [Clostridium sp.]